MVALPGGLLLAAPLAAWLCHGTEIGPLQFALATLVLATCAGVICFGSARVFQRRAAEARCVSTGLGNMARAAALGMLAFAVSAIMLGVSWGFTWADLLPTPQRLLCGLVILPLLMPACWLLARGVERAFASSTALSALVLRGLLWLLVGGALWLGFNWFVLDRWPLFSIPVWLLGVSLVVPLPLWLVADRPGLTLARSLCHAAGAAWLLACHLPMVHAG
jgi:hypothetical protein